MPTQNIHVLKGVVSLEELCEVVAKLQKQVRYLQNKGIDSENCREIGGWQVSEETLQALDGDVGMSTADDAPDPVRLWAGSVSKETAPWRVHKSGFGVATGWRIQSKDGAYPYVVMDPDNDLFAAYQDPNNYIIMTPLYLGSPAIRFIQNSGERGRLYSSSNQFVVSASSSLLLDSGGDIFLEPGVFGGRVVTRWSTMYNPGTNTTLQDELNNKQDLADAWNAYGVNLTFDPTTRNLKMYNRSGSQIAIVNIP